ncbi:MAG: ATP-grasp domain-containing protein [Prolixibacteraceae bacterium]|jgi:acetyl/propionyl-CoA carboxylase alpha subunit|nr:ATP-grasp domain-containing protein [Prolixibacteraceae bacterium]
MKPDQGTKNLINLNTMALLDKLLVANRGEIALRIIKSAKKLGIRTVAIYSEGDESSGYVMLADEKVALGKDELSSTFLNIDRIMGIARSTGSHAIHPGYGFLSESSDLARACEENQIIFVGPGSEILELTGNKPEAKQLAANLGIPVVTSHKIEFPGVLSSEPIEFPVLIKASHGGGGKGIQLVHNMEELAAHVEQSSRAALKYFGNGAIFTEKQIRNARHVEVQLLGDQYGKLIHLYERECSIQRNHQKIIEEAPAIFLSPQLRANLLDAAVKIGNSVKYVGAGTVEFLIDESGNFFFMEMNPRIQVEHAVTEEITGIDIVAEQLKIASGLPLSFMQEEVSIKGHAIEVRLYTEDPAKGFAPSTRQLRSINFPEHPSLRIEADINIEHLAKNQFDPLLLKLIARCDDREQAINLLRNSLSTLNVIGPETNTKFIENILVHEQYQQNNISVEFCKNNHETLVHYIKEQFTSTGITYLIALAVAKGYLENGGLSESDPWNSLGYWRSTPSFVPLAIDNYLYRIQINVNDKSNTYHVWNGTKTVFNAVFCSENSIEISIHGLKKIFFYQFDQQWKLHVVHKNTQYHIVFPGLLKHQPETSVLPSIETAEETAEITSPMHGKILEIFVKENQLIKKNEPLLIIEAMKSENKILSHKDARIRKIAVSVGTQVADHMPLIFLED